MPSHTSRERAKKSKKSNSKFTKAAGKSPAQKKKMDKAAKKSKKANR